jgi:site-specific recombinase XerD
MTAHPSWTLDTLIEAYEHHQRRTRGLRDQTLHGYGRFVRLFVRGVLGDHPIDPTRFRPSDVVEFVALLRGRFSPRSMKAVRTALRSFFRFLRAEGLCNEPLEAAIPIVAHWRLSTLPRYLSDEQLEQVLASPAASTPVGFETTPSWCALRRWGCDPARWLASISMTSIGVTALSNCPHARLAERPFFLSRTTLTYFPIAPAPLSRSCVEHRLKVTIEKAAKRCPSLNARRISPHTLRHTTAMHLLQSGVDITVIALWLGHESTATTHLYIEADLAMQKAALSRVENPGSRPLRLKAPDRLLAFLEGL